MTAAPDYNQLGAAALASAGWAPERAVDTDAYLGALTEDGYRPWPALESLLASAGGLVIPTAEGERLVIDPSEGLDMVTFERVEEYAREFGTELAPIGLAMSDHLTVYFGRNGHFYGSYDRYTCWIGAALEDAVGRLVTGDVETLSTG
ncbi:SUKH-3 domain-containing protein [Kribbella endophytica]